MLGPEDCTVTLERNNNFKIGSVLHFLEKMFIVCTVNVTLASDSQNRTVIAKITNSSTAYC